MSACPAAPAAPMALTPLEAFPWLAPSSPHPLTPSAPPRAPASARGRIMRHAGIAAAFGALCGAAVWLAGGNVAEPAPAMLDTDLAQSLASVDGMVLAEDAPLESTAAPEQPAAGDAALPITVQGRRAAAVAGAGPTPTQPAGAPAPRIAPSFAQDAGLGAELTVPASAPAPQLADSRASAATMQDFRKTLEQGRDAARAVIRLADRQKPPRGASAEALHFYWIREQNADAARNYRTYLDTLARLMRGKPSESTARQSLERARQTLAYLETMLADSQAALR